MSLRRKLVAVLIGGLASIPFQSAPAQAYCDQIWYEVTNTCSPCNQLGPVYYLVTGDHLICVS